MKSSSMIVLFGEPVTSRRGPSGFLVSAVVHALAFCLLIAGLNRPREVSLRSSERYSVRTMDLQQPKPNNQRLREKQIIEFPGKVAEVHPTLSGGAPAAAAAARLPRNFLTEKQAVQTLIQPDVRHDLIPQAALPQVLEWSPPKVPVNKIVAPAPKTAAAVNVKPSLDAPNQEPRVADINVSSTAFNTKVPLPAPSKTSPVSVPAAGQAQRIPETTSKNAGPPTPASIISLSDIQLQQGTATLPMITEIAPTPYTGSMNPGQPKGTAPTGSGRATDSKVAGTSAGQTAGNVAGTASGAFGNQPGPSSSASAVVGSGAGSNAVPGDTGLDTSGGRSVVQISEPKGGKFGVVVVGSPLTEEYPETANLWSGRLTYTVYLHIGTAKNWILQYSLPRSKEATSPAIFVGRPEAPWPYDMTRPSIDADVNADAIMVHGFVNALGRFEQLAIIFPTQLAETKFLIHALQQWQFRPALQNGVPTSVEVLLIIPTAEE